MAEREQDYAIGYGKPPVHSRFRKGRSGNPGGRPRGKRLATLLREALSETAMIEIDGRPRRVSKGQATVALLIDRAAEADPRWMKLLLDLVQKLDIGGDARDDDEEVDAEEAREFLIRELDRLAGDTPEASAVRDFLAGAQ
jgi:hypothetical protein